MLDISCEKYSGPTRHRNSCYQWRNLQWGCRRWATNSQPLDYKFSALAMELYNSKAIAGKELSLSCRCNASLYFSFLNCDWLPIREVQWLYWTQKFLVPVEKFTVRMPKVKFELATPGLQTHGSSHWAIQLNSYCWEGVEFIQLMYCIIIYLSFSTVIDFPSEKYFGFTEHRNSWYQQRNLQWGRRRWGSKWQPLDYKRSALTIELYSSKALAWEGVEFI